LIGIKKCTEPVHSVACKWFRVLRYAAAYKADSEPLDEFGKEMMSLTVRRRDLSMNRSGMEVNMTPPGQSATMIAVAGVRAPA
jgi:hypothetical protein